MGLETIRSLDSLDVDVGDVVKEIHGEYCLRCGILSGGTWESNLSLLVLSGTLYVPSGSGSAEVARSLEVAETRRSWRSGWWLHGGLNYGPGR